MLEGQIKGGANYEAWNSDKLKQRRRMINVKNALFILYLVTMIIGCIEMKSGVAQIDPRAGFLTKLYGFFYTIQYILSAILQALFRFQFEQLAEVIQSIDILYLFFYSLPIWIVMIMEWVTCKKNSTAAECRILSILQVCILVFLLFNLTIVTWFTGAFVTPYVRLMTDILVIPSLLFLAAAVAGLILNLKHSKEERYLWRG